MCDSKIRAIILKQFENNFYCCRCIIKVKEMCSPAGRISQDFVPGVPRHLFPSHGNPATLPSIPRESRRFRGIPVTPIPM